MIDILLFGDNMPVVEIPLSDKEKKVIEKIWRHNCENIREKALKQIGWNSMEDFCADIFRIGMDVASKNPKEFIKDIREKKDSVFKKRKPKPPKKYEEEFKKAYA